MLAIESEQSYSEPLNLPYVELRFDIFGQTLPSDHGYALYSNISHLCPQLHEQKWLNLQTIMGIPDGKGKIYLTEKSRLRIRVPGDMVPAVYPLAGKALTIGKHLIRLGIPQIFMLQPASRLRSRIVVIKGFQEPEAFLSAAKRQLEALGIQGRVWIPLNAEGESERKTIKIKKYTVVGFGLEVADLSDEDSIKLQIAGCGGKRRMGCGVFARLRYLR
ncbi:CRISPR-associated protein, Cas6-related (plasmid) [Cylindrospermum sp. NIES-4074]|nr:CRISPR-associated protein, Cas6-related [Cylindrospermum sp. NIES-4074]